MRVNTVSQNCLVEDIVNNAVRNTIDNLAWLLLNNSCRQFQQNYTLRDSQHSVNINVANKFI